MPVSQEDAVKLAALQYQAYFLDRTAAHSTVGFCRSAAAARTVGMSTGVSCVCVFARGGLRGGGGGGANMFYFSEG